MFFSLQYSQKLESHWISHKSKRCISYISASQACKKYIVNKSASGNVFSDA